jgi:hypothetical protein
MKYTITDDRLLELFSNVMEEYSELEVAERSYDFYNSEKGRYADLDVYNYYKDVEEDWEDDGWILQVQYMKGDAGEGMELPILRYADWWFRTIIPMFGNYFEPLLKEWFNKTYSPKTPIKTLTTEQD